MVQHIRLTLLSALVVLGSGCAVLPVSEEFQTDAAGNPVAANTTGNAATANTEGRPVRECRYAKGTGTKMRSRICYSQEEWARIDAATAEDQDTDDFFRRSRENAAVTGNVAAPPTGGSL